MLRFSAGLVKNSPWRPQGKSLIRQGADVHAKDEYGFTPLCWAADAAAVAEVLLEHEADMNAKTITSFTPLRWAVQEDNPETAKVFRQYGRR